METLRLETFPSDARAVTVRLVRAGFSEEGANQKCEPQCELGAGRHRRARTNGAYLAATIGTQLAPTGSVHTPGA